MKEIKSMLLFMKLDLLWIRGGSLRESKSYDVVLFGFGFLSRNGGLDEYCLVVLLLVY